METKKIILEGIPIEWDTNLSKEDLYQFWLHIADDADYLLSGINNESFSISVNPYFKDIPFKEGCCFCGGFSGHLTVIYRTIEEWEIWQEQKAEEERLESEKEDLRQAEEVLFETEISEIEKLIVAAVSAGNSSHAVSQIHNYNLLRKHYYSPESTFLDTWCSADEAVEFLAMVADVNEVIAYLNNIVAPSWIFYVIGENYFSCQFRLTEKLINARGPTWRDQIFTSSYGKHFLENTDLYFNEAVLRRDVNGDVFREICLHYQRENAFEKAKNFCQQAIDLGLTDGTKSGFLGRLKRLRNAERKFNQKS